MAIKSKRQQQILDWLKKGNYIAEYYQKPSLVYFFVSKKGKLNLADPITYKPIVPLLAANSITECPYLLPPMPLKLKFYKIQKKGA